MDAIEKENDFAMIAYLAYLGDPTINMEKTGFEEWLTLDKLNQLMGALDIFQEMTEFQEKLENMEKIIFNDPDSQESIEFYCLEQTKINNQNYLLVTEEEDGDSEAYILKETSSEDEETVYEMVEEEAEFEAIAKVFTELMDDVDFEY